MKMSIARIAFASGLFIVFCLGSFGFACLTHWAPRQSLIEVVSGIFTGVFVLGALYLPIKVCDE